jgi:hypothetical protein
MKTTIGGDRLGSGNKQSVSLKNYERSTHDLSYLWRSSMSSGTLVPFMSEIGLPGDSFDIDLDVDVKTLPTIGPLFGSYKVQLDVFECPIRLYNGKLHMNMLNIGMDMSQIKLPQLELNAEYDPDNLGDNSQINSSSIYSYLNMRGLGRDKNNAKKNVAREFNAVSYLGYWDVYKNYYANKQEERGFVIHQNDGSNKFDTKKSYIEVNGNDFEIFQNPTQISTSPIGGVVPVVRGLINFEWNNTQQVEGLPNKNDFSIILGSNSYALTSLFSSIVTSQSGPDTYTFECEDYTGPLNGNLTWVIAQTSVANTIAPGTGEPQLQEFALDNIDEMRANILASVNQPSAVTLTKSTLAPYGLGLGCPNGDDWENAFAKSTQEGLGIKTYQSDLFNNWISTEWIDGPNGINDVTAVSTSGNEFTIDSLNLANKVYNMLNRIAISGGSYDDWLDAVYTHERAKSVESPVYHGSLIKELGFEEVIGTAATEVDGVQQPLGELGGRGRLTGKNKGGKVRVKVNEPCYVIGIVSLTPRIDYSQGNKWDTNLKTMNDLHKPALDEIGYQDLITDQMAWFDTKCVNDPTYGWITETQSAGKQPAWINYMTNVNQTRGNFAIGSDNDEVGQMFMTLNRRYEQTSNGIGDLTTYVDPNKYNNIFADGNLDSQNFWVQISNKITARRKMSAKVIPNL